LNDSLHCAGVTGMVVSHEFKSVSILLFDEGFTMAIDKILKIIRKQTPIPPLHHAMGTILYASDDKTTIIIVILEM
jgi:hypothetical protein